MSCLKKVEINNKDKIIIRQQDSDSNSLTTTNNLNIQQINSFGCIGPFYSIRLKELNKVYNYNIQNLAVARAASITLFHLYKYHRGLQTNILRTYGFNWATMNKVLNILIELGLINGFLTKRITNIQKHVTLTNYGITVKGKEIAYDLNCLLLLKISNLKK